MGLFDKAKNYLAGTHAKVTLSMPAIGFPSMPIAVKITAAAAADFECGGVYVDVSATETVEIRPGKERPQQTEIIRDTEPTYSAKVQIAGPFAMKEGETKEWTGVVTLPREVQPTYRGKNGTHVVQLQARLETKGNDPDSGWHELRIGAMS